LGSEREGETIVNKEEEVEILDLLALGT